MTTRAFLTSICAVSSFCFVTAVFAAGPTAAWETPATLSAPESALYDAANDRIYVSNVGGSPMEKDGNGFLAVLSTEGKIVNAKWVTGLDAPKGMAQFGNKLYVADIDTLVEIDVTAGKIAKRHQAPRAIFLNDVAVNEQGIVFVSDMMGNAVYRLTADKMEQWIQTDALENPNGLHAEQKQLIVGSWGKLGDKGFSTEVPGHLKAVSYADGAVKSLGNGKSVGNLDGVESDGKGSYYVTDWIAGKLLHVTAAGDSTDVLTLKQGSADHEVILDKGLVIIPMMKENKVVAYKLK